MSTPCLRKAGTFLWSECSSLSRSAGYAESSSSICLLFRPSYPGNYFFLLIKCIKHPRRFGQNWFSSIKKQLGKLTVYLCEMCIGY